MLGLVAWLGGIGLSGLAGEIRFVGFDSSPKLIDAMRKKTIHGLILQNPLRMGRLGVETLVKHLSGEAVEKSGIKPIAKLVAYTVAGCKADEMGVGPAYAIPKLLKMTGMKVEDINLWEVNEAFASQAIYCMQQLGLYDKKELWVSDSDKRIFNVNGGAIALGHPLGATGAKLMTSLLHELERSEGRYGLQTMCIGHGMATATIIERLS